MVARTEYQLARASARAPRAPPRGVVRGAPDLRRRRALGAAAPCEGSSSNCTWTCNLDDQGNIQPDNVTCGVSNDCVDAATNAFIIGACDESPSAGDISGPFAQIERIELHLEESGLLCEEPKESPRSRGDGPRGDGARGPRQSS